MNTLEIELVLKSISPLFIGVYARNRLSKRILKVPCMLVANTDADDREGQHWIATYIDEDRHGEYYDPYGLPPLHKAFVNFLDKQCTTWTYNAVRVQHLNSLVCGQHCIYYLVQRCRGKSMKDITSMLRTDFYANTYFVDDFVRNLTYYLS